jgi:ABC-type dipeptide/oligopeptide/nickel transport system permease component
MFQEYRMFYASSRYVIGFLVALITSFIGLWLLYRAAIREKSFMDGTLQIPMWLVISLGILMQSLLVIYIYLGIRAGFFG